MREDKKILQMKVGILILLEVALIVGIFFVFNDSLVSGDIGDNVTVSTQLQVGNVSPEVVNVSINNDDATITLVANSTKTVFCEVLVRDYNNDSTINNITARLFDNTDSAYDNSDDNNLHYTNNSCYINTSFGSWNGINDDDYLAFANCTFAVEYYAQPGTWNCTAEVTDHSSLTDRGYDTSSIDQLLAVGLPSTINYGTVNATFVSAENATNVTNFGNVALNLSLSGYGVSEGDGLAMNCTLGSVGTIDLDYEKYNLTSSTPGVLSLTHFEGNYTNLTDTPTVKEFDLNYRQNDTDQGVDDYNTTYWRIYVPLGVAGTCNGTILFGATTAAGS